MTEGLEFESRKVTNFLHVVKTGSESQPASYQWVPEAICPWITWPGLETDHSPPTSADIKKTRIHTSTLPCLVKQRASFYSISSNASILPCQCVIIRRSTCHTQPCHDRQTKKRTKYVAWGCERTIPTERPPFVDEVSTNFCGEGATWIPSTSSIVLARLSGPRSRSTTSQNIW
jgi:hypothetical protein